MPIEHIKLMINVVVVGLIILYLIRLHIKSQVCIICKKQTKYMYLDASQKKTLLCRKHLIDRWYNDFVSTKYDILIMEPDFVNVFPEFVFDNVADLIEYKYPKNFVASIENSIKNIQNKNCTNCNSLASVAYYGKNQYSIKKWEITDDNPLYYCKKCMGNQLKTIFMQSNFNLYECIYEISDKGVYHEGGF